MTEQEPVSPENFDNEFAEMESGFFDEKIKAATTILEAAFIVKDYTRRHPNTPFMQRIMSHKDIPAGTPDKVDLVPFMVGGMRTLYGLMTREVALNESELGMQDEMGRASSQVILDAIIIISKHFKANPEHWISAEITAEKDVHENDVAVADVKKMMVLGLFSFYSFLHSDLCELGKNDEIEQATRDVYFKYKGVDDDRNGAA